jgi:type IV pilus assembly protein PilY1
MDVVCTTTVVSPATGVASCTPEAPSAANSYVTTSCNTVTTGPTSVTSCTAAAASSANNYTETSCTAGSGGYSDSLADVAMYYYQTDLRTSALGNCSGGLQLNLTTCLAGTTPDNCGVCENNVPGSGGDITPSQHMTTFTLGLGVDGTLGYADNYLSGGSADFNAIVQGTKNWPNPITNSGAERIDDLWHAAVDGRGVYYSARDPDTLVTGISNALAGVTARAGSAAAAATSNLEPVAGDNYLFVALYRTVFWDGDLQARTIDPVTGAISADPIWTAQPLLDLKVGANSDTRTIYTFDSGAANKLKPFLWANLTASERGYFDSVCTGAAQLSQCGSLTSAEQALAVGENLVGYLRGQNGHEGTLYRDREHVLGDMVTSQPVYVKKPPFEYADSGYVTFRDTTQAGRTPMVYVAANDGMLHAFNADSGQESWAYVPPAIMGNLYRLADKTYSANHRYYVDGSPTVVDICPNAPSGVCTGAQWKTILVGGFNAGGRGYYALDITDPAAPKAMWNFSVADDSDMGYSFGNPIVTKRKDGTWVVVVTSGYNNILPGSGVGYLYVLNADTGELLEKISSGVGDTATPSGLAKINVWVDLSTDNTAERFYGGDLQGNLFRFELDPGSPPAAPVSTAGTALALAQLGATQPITTKPELTLIPYGGVDYPAVMFGTGRYLGLTDLSNTDQQTVYAIKDDLSSSGLGAVRTNGVLVQQTLTNFTGASGEQLRSTSDNTVDWSGKSGWYLDLNPSNASPGERVNVDVQLQLGSLTVATNVPSDNACNVGGYAFLYNLDFRSGQYLQTALLKTAGTKLASNALVAGMNTIRLQSGKILTIITDTAGGITSQETPTAVAGSGTASRVSWRELIQ